MKQEQASTDLQRVQQFIQNELAERGKPQTLVSVNSAAGSNMAIVLRISGQADSQLKLELGLQEETWTDIRKWLAVHLDGQKP